MEKSENIIKTRLDYLSFLVILLFALPVESSLNAQTQKTWQWVKQLGGSSWEVTAGIVLDSKNNIYVAGSFNNELNIGSKKIKSLGSKDIFLGKFAENGDLKDIYSFGGKGEDAVNCLGISKDNNIILGGRISDSVSFNKNQAPGVGERLFVSAIDQKGKTLWVNTISVQGKASLYLLKTDSQGEIYVSGAFAGTLESGENKVKSKGKDDIFLARLGNRGDIEKLISFGGEEDDSPGSISVNSSGNVILSGVFNKSFETNGTSFTLGQKDTKTSCFITELDNELSIKWIKYLYGKDYLSVSSVQFDGTDSFYATGSFSSTLNLGDTLLVSKGLIDIFLLKYMPSGKLEWSKSFGSWYYDYANHLNIDNLGGAIITGSIGDTILVDSLLIKPVSKHNSALLIQFSPEGQVIWGDCISGTGRSFSSGSVIDKQGNLYLTGSFRNSFEKGDKSMRSIGVQDIFLAKYFNCQAGKAKISGQLSFCPGTNTSLTVGNGFKNVIWNDTILNKNSILVNKPGSYWVSLYDKRGCRLTDTVQVIENKSPYFSLGNDTSIFVSDSLMLTAPDLYKTLTWQDLTNQPTYLARSEDGKVGTVDYWLTVTDSMDCQFTDTISINYKKDKNWIDLEKAKILVYPNPATEKIYWRINTKEQCRLVVEFTDMHGKVLYHQYFKQYSSGEVKELNLQSMSSGSYVFWFYNLSSGKKFRTIHVIKQ
jgi:hypothetical protein